MKVDEPPLECVDEDGGEDPHEAGRDDEIGRMLRDHVAEGATPVLPRIERCRGTYCRGYAASRRSVDPPALTIGDDGDDRPWDAALLTGARERGHVGPGPRNENDDPSVHGPNHNEEAPPLGGASETDRGPGQQRDPMWRPTLTPCPGPSCVLSRRFRNQDPRLLRPRVTGALPIGAGRTGRP